jgi:formylglycine-generating enzyme required for sulfatase activity
MNALIAPNPNTLTPRAAMGLPESFVDRLGADVLSRHANLLGQSAEALVAVVESATAPMARRYAAGKVLAYRGDPRINVGAPQMVRLDGGRVTLGLPHEEVERIADAWAHAGVLPEWIAKECPQHTVELAPFAVARFPVTNVEYRAFLEATGSRWIPSSWPLGVYPSYLANHPVWTVPPEAADAYAVWLSARTGRGFRLLTEAEWEYAASGGDGREFPWGDAFDPACANTVEEGPLTTTPVGMFPLGRTASGIDDMAGNVEEYTACDYRAYPGGEFIADDLQLAQGAYRVARGGSFSRFGDLARCRRRHGWYHSPIYAMGFRLGESL